MAVTSHWQPSLETAAAPQIYGTGNVWSPEPLLCASITNCVSRSNRAARFKWLSLKCPVERVLERAGQVSQFTRYPEIRRHRPNWRGAKNVLH